MDCNLEAKINPLLPYGAFGPSVVSQHQNSWCLNDQSPSQQWPGRCSILLALHTGRSPAEDRATLTGGRTSSLSLSVRCWAEHHLWEPLPESEEGGNTQRPRSASASQQVTPLSLPQAIDAAKARVRQNLQGPATVSSSNRHYLLPKGKKVTGPTHTHTHTP